MTDPVARAREAHRGDPMSILAMRGALADLIAHADAQAAELERWRRAYDAEQTRLGAELERLAEALKVAHQALTPDATPGARLNASEIVRHALGVYNSGHDT